MRGGGVGGGWPVSRARIWLSRNRPSAALMGRISHATAASDPPPRSEVVAVFIFAVVLYVNTLFGEFVFDDHEAVQQNIDVRCGIAIHLTRAFITTTQLELFTENILYEMLCGILF